MKLPVTAYEMAEPEGPVTFSVNVLVQLTRSSRYKFAYHAGLDVWKLERNLGPGSFGLGDYGMIPKTTGEDGKELGALVLVSEPTFVGCLIESRVIGSFRVTDGSEYKTRIVCVPIFDHIFKTTKRLDDLGPSVSTDIKLFFSNDDPLEFTDFKFDDWGTREEAWARIDEAHALFLRERRDEQDSFEGGGN